MGNPVQGSKSGLNLIYLLIYLPSYLCVNLKMSREREVIKDIVICFNDSLPQC